MIDSVAPEEQKIILSIYQRPAVTLSLSIDH